MIYWDLEQRTDEWKKLKAGKISASEISKILPGKRGAYTKSRAHYMDRLAMEIITGEFSDSFQSADMLRGIELEPQAVAEYEMQTGQALYSAGGIENDDFPGCWISPDGLHGKPHFTKGAEIKCMIGANHTAEIFAITAGKEINQDYYYQMQFSMLISGATEWEYILYNPDCLIPELRLFHAPIKIDMKACAMMSMEIIKFKAELAEYVKQLGIIVNTIKGTK